MSDPARNRWLAIVAVRLAGSLGAIFGVLLVARGIGWPSRLLGVAIVLSALYMMATVPLALTQRWRSPRGDES